ncbi:MAG: hypothetical protein H6704_22065 [Myxococcales bacterium]|nr:hypothetical protein [Myxococcales bacterium]
MARRPGPLAPAFARRMAPLAVLAGLVVGVALPWAWGRLALAERQSEAAVWARQVAEQVEAQAHLRPRLWAYDRARLSAALIPVASPPVSAHVHLQLPGRAGTIEAGPAVAGGAVTAWAAVRVEGRAAARVQVELPAGPLRARSRWVWSASAVAGLLLALTLFVLPLSTVRRGDARNLELWDALVDANAGLEARVAARTAELRALGGRLVSVQEEERARISRDLHDELGQTLTGLRLRLTAIEARLGDPVGAAAQVEQAMAAVDGAVEDVRRLAHNLRPPALDALGLATALRGHAERWAETAGLALEVDLAPVEPPADVAEVLFRVGQEALTNVARHADASRVRLVLDAADDGWRLVIEDDGRGLEQDASGGGLGLVGARERVEGLGGYLDVDSPAAGGVRLLAWVPQV